MRRVRARYQRARRACCLCGAHRRPMESPLTLCRCRRRRRVRRQLTAHVVLTPNTYTQSDINHFFAHFDPYPTSPLPHIRTWRT